MPYSMTLKFRLDETRARAKNPALPSARQVLKQLKVKSDAYCWAEVDVTCSEFKSLLDTVAAGNAYRMESLTLQVRQVEDVSNPAEWYVVSPDVYVDVDDWLVGKVRADRVNCKENIAACAATPWSVLVKESLKNYLESHRFRGAEFAWLEDVGKKQAPQWFRLIPDDCIGRGVVHPWLDWEVVQKQVGAAYPVDSENPTAPPNFEARALRAEVRNNDPVLKALLLHDPHMQIITPIKVRRQYLPDCDFAYYYASPHAVAVCVNRHVHEALVTGGLVPARFFGPLEIVDDIADAAVDLDLLGSVPHPPQGGVQVPNLIDSMQSMYEARLGSAASAKSKAAGLRSKSGNQEDVLSRWVAKCKREKSGDMAELENRIAAQEKKAQGRFASGLDSVYTRYWAGMPTKLGSRPDSPGRTGGQSGGLSILLRFPSKDQPPRVYRGKCRR